MQIAQYNALCNIYGTYIITFFAFLFYNENDFNLNFFDFCIAIFSMRHLDKKEKKYYDGIIRKHAGV